MRLLPWVFLFASTSAAAHAGSADDEARLVAQAASCAPVPACDAAPRAGLKRSFRHWGSTLLSKVSASNHRGHDLYLNPGEPQVVIAKLAYGVVDKDLEDEDVDIYVLRGCGDTWEQLGTTRTTSTDDGPSVEGVASETGRVYFPIPADKALALGRHRLRVVVAGDLTAAELFIEVREPGAKVFVSDVDGTLTDSELGAFIGLLTSSTPSAQPDAAAVLNALVARGYRPFYLTARPEWFVGRTRKFLDDNGFPPGVLHTALNFTGAQGGAAAPFKAGELARLAARGLTPSIAFGNTSTDADAYEAAGILPVSNRLFVQFDDAAHGGRRFDSYAALADDVAALPAQCTP